MQIEKPDKSSGKVIPLPPTLTAQQIITTEYPEPTWAVPGLIPEGLTILASRPKMGKGWLCLEMAIGVASGGTVLGQIDVPTTHKVLYIALEDTPRRLKSRVQMILQGNTPPAQLFFAVTWPRLDGTGLQELRNWMSQHPTTGLILTEERLEIVTLLRNEGGPMRLGNIAGALGKKKPNVINLLNNLIDQDLVERAGHGKYQLKPSSEESAEPSAAGPKAVETAETSVSGELSERDELAAISQSLAMDTALDSEMTAVNI